MSDNYGTYTPASQSGSGGAMDSAKEEAEALKDTVVEQASGVANTAKEEVGNVAREAKYQARDLYRQTQSELREQAAVQQQRVAEGLRGVGDELSAMADGSETQGLASDVVRQAGQRAESVASWLEARDPGSLLAEVKSFARRKPGTFIAIAAVAGVVAGRLTRSLAANSADEADRKAPSSSPTLPPPLPTGVTPSAQPPTVGATSLGATTAAETPLYSESAAALGDPAANTDGLR